MGQPISVIIKELFFFILVVPNGFCNPVNLGKCTDHATTTRLKTQNISITPISFLIQIYRESTSYPSGPRQPSICFSAIYISFRFSYKWKEDKCILQFCLLLFSSMFLQIHMCYSVYLQYIVCIILLQSTMPLNTYITIPLAIYLLTSIQVVAIVWLF